jgi:hypothetical protein
MSELPWVLVAILVVALIAVVVLWLRSRLAAAAATDTLHDIDQALADRGPSGLTSFEDGLILRLLAKGQINIQGRVHSFGVVQNEAGEARAFLTAEPMSTLIGGDSFSSLRGKLHKVDVGHTPSEVTVPHAQSQSMSPPAPTPSAPAASVAPTPTPVEEEDEEEAGDRTVLFAPARGGGEASTEDPMAGFPTLLVHAGPDTGTRFPLPFTHATIGRDKGNIIPLGDTGSSRLHCEIFYRGGEFVLHDASSTNGTLCNGEKISERILDFGDQIQVADTIMEFTFEGHEVKDANPTAAIGAFEKCLERDPGFLLALKNLAFLLERDVRRQKEAEPLWQKIIQLEQRR